MEPLIALTLDRKPRVYQGGDTVRCEYQIDAIDPDEIQAVEMSVLWYTEGKGEPDMGVHYFRRTTQDDVEEGDLRPMIRTDVKLPLSPLSYEGVIVKIRWCVRVRLFLTRGREYLREEPFQLGGIPAAKVATAGAPQPIAAEEHDDAE